MTDYQSFDIVFPREYLRVALMVSLMSVWVLVALFHYLNTYTRRRYFSIWTAAWLFYALWLTIGVTVPNPPLGSIWSIARQSCVSVSAVFLLWGSMDFLGHKAPEKLYGLFIAFLLTWSYAGCKLLTDPFQTNAPVFTLIGLASIFAGCSFYHLRKSKKFVAVGMLCLGFVLWGTYLIAYPFSQKFTALFNAGFLFSAVLQLFIAVSMIVLVLEEARHINEQVIRDIEVALAEKSELQQKIVSTEEAFRSVLGQARGRDDLQKAYDELRQSQAAIVQQERLRALGQMASGIAHDVNNALSPIVAFSEIILQKEAGLSGSSRKNLEHIQTAASDIAHIVSRMGEFSRRREKRDELQMLSVSKVVQQVVELTSPCWRDIPQSRGVSIRLESRVHESLPQLYGNQSEIREALTNIVLNATDALPNGGSIVISGRVQSAVRDGEPDDLILEIGDDGIGMDEATRQRCLEPFFSTKRQKGGSGLGLAMVYGVVLRHKGKIEVQSEVGKGTTFCLIFPLRPPPAAPVAAAPTATGRREGLRVLCIDDEPMVRELLQQIIESSNHKVQTAGSALAGLEMFEEAMKHQRPFDVIITDLGMPELSGRHVVSKVKALSPNTPVIMLTGWGSMIHETGEDIEDVDALLSKPIRLNDLLHTVDSVTRCSKLATPAFAGATARN